MPQFYSRALFPALVLCSALLPVTDAAAVDPTYARAAAATGGQVLELKPGELNQATGVLVTGTGGHSASLVVKQITLAQSHTVTDFIVEPDTAKIPVTLAATGPDSQPNLSLSTPDHKAITGSEPGNQRVVLSTVRVFVVSLPQPGVWHAEAWGAKGTASLHVDMQKAAGVDAIDFYRFNFVIKNPDIHGGYFPTQNIPAVGERALVDANLLGPVKDASFTLVDEEGNTIQKISLRQHYPNAARDDFIGTIRMPPTAFHVAVSGHDSNGAAFQRIMPRLFP